MGDSMDTVDMLGMSLDDIMKHSTASGRAGGERRDRGRVNGGGGRVDRNGVARRAQTRPKIAMRATPTAGTFRSAMISAAASQVSRPGGVGPVRRMGVGRVARRSTAPYDRRELPPRSSDSILDRLGDKVGSTAIRVSNLNYDVMEEDVRELFQHVGKIEQCEVKFDKSGRSEGEATLLFGSRALAEKAVSQFNNRTLDQTPMHVEILEGSFRFRGGGEGRPVTSRIGTAPRHDNPSAGIFANDPDNSDGGENGSSWAKADSFRPISGRVGPATRPVPPGGANNIRAGIFGTALNGAAPVSNSFDDNAMQNFGNGRGFHDNEFHGVGGAGEVGAGIEPEPVHFSVTLKHPPPNIASSGGGERGGVKGATGFKSRGIGGLGRNGGQARNVSGGRKPEISSTDLDAQLEAHMALR